MQVLRWWCSWPFQLPSVTSLPDTPEPGPRVTMATTAVNCITVTLQIYSHTYCFDMVMWLPISGHVTSCIRPHTYGHVTSHIRSCDFMYKTKGTCIWSCDFPYMVMWLYVKYKYMIMWLSVYSHVTYLPTLGSCRQLQTGETGLC